ncbi:MAG: peptidylprolyl isomerase [Bacteroidales bacterium]|nr:peptidylprolyl isomerase [Bacteroidales bacterium]
MKKFVYLALILSVALSCKGRGQKAEIAPVQPEPDTVAVAKAAQALPQEPVFDIVTSMGTIRVKLYKDTPRHRDNFEKLALSHYYDSLLFHRVINGFMIQGGDPFTRDTSLVERYGEGGPSYNIPAEMRADDGTPLHRHKKGALAAARRSDLANPFKESSGSQFYLVQNPDNCIHLDGEYTVFGETVAGLNVIDKIAATPTDRYDRPLSDVRILRIVPNDELNKVQLEKESGMEFDNQNDD